MVTKNGTSVDISRWAIRVVIVLVSAGIAWGVATTQIDTLQSKTKTLTEKAKDIDKCKLEKETFAEFKVEYDKRITEFGEEQKKIRESQIRMEEQMKAVRKALEKLANGD